MAATLIDANQNSNSPYMRVDMRFTSVIDATSTRPMAGSGTATHWCRMRAPAIASIGTTTTQKYQYSQPVVNPASRPKAKRGKSVNARVPGCASASSPSMRITRYIRPPAIT